MVRRESIKKGGSDDFILSKHMQEESIGRIITNFHNFKAKAVYVDKGFGGFQAETLEKYFYEIGQFDVFQAVDFGSAYRDTNPITNEARSRNLKGVLVHSLQRQFEKCRIEISSEEEGKIEDIDEIFKDKLTFQLNNYVIDHYTNRDEPVFGHKGDHALDALMIANFGFIEKIENSLDFTPEYSSGIIAVKSSMQETVERGGFLDLIDKTTLQKFDELLKKDVDLMSPQEKKELLTISAQGLKKNKSKMFSTKIKRTRLI